MRSLHMMAAVVAVVMLLTSAAIAQYSQPMTLAECVDYALDNNPRLSSARESLDAAESRIGQAAAAGKPHLEVQTEYADQTPASGSFRNYRAALSARQLLYDSGETSDRTTQAQLQRDAEAASLHGLQLTVANEVVGDYLAILRTQRLADVAVEIAEQTQEHLSVAKARYEAGTVARADVLRGEVEVARTELEIVRAEKAVQLAQARLLNSLGMSQDQQIEIAAIDTELPASIEQSTAMQLASENRSELVAVDAQIGAAEAAIRLAKTPQRPQVQLQGDWGTQENSFPPGDEAWMIGVTASISLYDGGLTRENIDETEAQLRSLEADRNNQLQIIQLEVVEATLNATEARERIRLADEEVQLARHSLDVATGRYEIGEGTLVEVIDARTALRRALAGQAEAIYDYHAARADVARAVGLLPTEELPEE